MRDWRAYVRKHLRLGEIRPEREAEVVEEIAQQLEDAYQEARRQGLNEVEAESAAGAHITDWESLSGALRESPAAQIPLLDRIADRAIEREASGSRFRQFLVGFWGDVLYALRLLRKNPGFAVAAVATLAVGIGANTAVFSIIDSTLFFPLPYSHPSRVVFAGTSNPRVGGGQPYVLDAVFGSWERENHSFAALAAYDVFRQMTLTGGGGPERLRVAEVTSGFLPALGVQPMLGRAFRPSETRRGGPEVAILTYSLWRSRFHANPRVVGETAYLNDQPYTVIGVMPAAFEFPGEINPALLVPLGLSDAQLGGRQILLLRVIGRLKSGVSVGKAQADLEVILRQVTAATSGGARHLLRGDHVRLISLHEWLVGNAQLALLVLWGAVGFLLLIACVNVANLTLARALARQKEIAVRLSLGAHRRRVARQLLTENLLVAALGAAAGLAIAYGVVLLIRQLGPADLPRLRNASIDLPVLAFTALLVTLAGILAGLAPVRAAWRLPTAEALNEGTRSSTDRGHRRLRSALAVAEIAIALILVVASGLFVRSFLRITSLDLGLDPRHVLTAEVALPLARYANAVQRRSFFDSLLKRVRVLPGVKSAAAADAPPMMNFDMAASVDVEGVPKASGIGAPGGGVNVVSPGFFRTMRIPVIEGREFQARDSVSNASVVIVNQAFANRYLPPHDALGQRIRSGFLPGWARVVGVVGDVRQRGLLNEPTPTIFLPYAQHPTPFFSLVVRTRGDPGAIVPALRSQVEDLDHNLPVFGVATMEERLGKMEAARRFEMVVLGIFALVALMLAALGVYGVISYSAGERTHEIGIRMAMGAEKGAVMRMIVGKTLAVALTGVAIGIGGAFALTRYLQSLLYQVRPDDPWTFALAAVVLVGAALLAGYLPARRATEIDPISALRHE